MELSAIQESVHRRINNLRNLDRLLCDERFLLLWSQATQEQREVIVKDIDNLNYEGVKRWLRSAEKPIEIMSLLELKQKARTLGIYNWSRLGKEELIFEITKAQNDQRTTLRVDSKLVLQHALACG
jgi:hypothetical protein